MLKFSFFLKKKTKKLFLSHFHAPQFSSYSFLGRLSQMSLKSCLRGYMYRNHSLLKVAEFLFKFGTQSYYWLFFSFLTQTLTIFLYHNQEKKIIEHFLKREFQHMASAPDGSSLSSVQDTNRFFGVNGNWILDLLFNHQKTLLVELTRTYKRNYFFLTWELRLRTYFKNCTI